MYLCFHYFLSLWVNYMYCARKYYLWRYITYILYRGLFKCNIQYCHCTCRIDYLSWFLRDQFNLKKSYRKNIMVNLQFFCHSRFCCNSKPNFGNEAAELISEGSEIVVMFNSEIPTYRDPRGFQLFYKQGKS